MRGSGSTSSNRNGVSSSGLLRCNVDLRRGYWLREEEFSLVHGHLLEQVRQRATHFHRD